jgi:Holliday junction resolvase RusA-like endonuclease
MKLTIKGNPLAKQSVKVTKTKQGIRGFQPQKIINGKADIRSQVIAQLPKGFTPFDKGLKIGYVFFFSAPKSLTKAQKNELETKGYYPKTTKPDIDNLIKHLNDALEGILFVNDSQIYEYIKVLKYYGKTPQIKIIVES